MSNQVIKITVTKEDNTQYNIDSLKNINRLNALIISQCGKRCFSNLKTDTLDKNENDCISTCIQKYFNTLEIGDKIYDLFYNKDINTSDLLKGRYENIVNKLNSLN